MPQKLILDGDIFPSLNKLIDLSKQHWSGYAKLKANLTNVVYYAALRQCKKVKKSRYPIHIKFKWYLSNARRDPDNIASAKKFILDGLVKAYILEGDTLKFINKFTDEFVVDRENPRVEVYF